MKVWMLLLLSFSFSAYSSEFSHIKLNPEFEHYLTAPKKKSNLSKTLTHKSLSNAASTEAVARQNMHSKMMSALLGRSPNKGFTNPIPVDGEESPLFEEIRNHLEGAHNQLGQSEVANINRLNQQFNLGTSNFSGFSWQSLSVL